MCQEWLEPRINGEGATRSHLGARPGKPGEKVSACWEGCASMESQNGGFLFPLLGVCFRLLSHRFPTRPGEFPPSFPSGFHWGDRLSSFHPRGRKVERGDGSILAWDARLLVEARGSTVACAQPAGEGGPVVGDGRGPFLSRGSLLSFSEREGRASKGQKGRNAPTEEPPTEDRPFFRKQAACSPRCCARRHTRPGGGYKRGVLIRGSVCPPGS